MPKSKELVIRVEDEPGALGDCCRVLSDLAINIFAFQGYECEGQSVVRMVVDKPVEAKRAFDAANIRCAENEVLETALPHYPGELSRAASLLGKAGINISYTYCGIDSRSSMPVVFFGVSDVAKAAPLLDEIANEGTRAA